VVVLVNSAADRVTAGGVALTGLCVRRGDVEAVRDVTGVFATGSLTAVIGPNGAGKSSLLEAIAGRLSPSGGTLECTVPASDIAYLAQVSHLDLRVPVTVFDFVAAGAWRRTGIFAGVDARLARQTHAALRATDLLDCAGRLLAQLSSGQLQRARFAQLLVHDPQLILLDEPFTSMDEATTSHLVALVAAWHREQRTIIVVLHDRDLARELCPTTLVLDRKLIAWGPTEQALAAHRWRHVA
jgi:zinc/manganese transport system ATP-binding protein